MAQLRPNTLRPAPFAIYAPKTPPRAEVRVRRLILLVFHCDDPALTNGEADAFLRRWIEQPDQMLRVVVIGDAAAAPEGFRDADLGPMLDDAPPTEVWVHGTAPGSPGAPLPAALLLLICDLSIAAARGFSLNGETWDYQRAEEGRLRALFLFPGTIHPVSLGAHRRAMTVMAAMLQKGFDLEILHTGPNHAARMAALPLLSLCAVRVQSFANTRDLSAKLKVKTWRRCYDAIRRIAGQQSSLPETFRERRALRDNRSLRTALNRLDVRRVDVIFINYAWFAASVLRSRAASALLVCDTHDVQHHRAQGALSPIDRAFFDPGKERRAELGVLRRMDRVIAISSRDAALLKADLGEDRVAVGVSSFAYCHLPVREHPPCAPLRFGFIGHRMAANVAALTFVLDEWWPVIRRFSPESVFQVAGSVCADPACLERTFLDSSVQLLGFVPNLQNFYRNVDVALSPVMTAGGMNYKNAEALAAGVTLFTNELGAETLQPLRLRHVIRNRDGLLEALDALERDPQASREARIALQAETFRRFQFDDALDAIIDAIRARAAP